MSIATGGLRLGTVCYVGVTIGGSDYYGSGVLIAPDEVLTASHLLWDTNAGEATNVFVLPGYDSLKYGPYGGSDAVNLHYNKIDDSGGQISFEQSQQDFAVIHIRDSFAYCGTMGLQQASGSTTASVSGYPGQDGFHQITRSGEFTQDPDYSLFDGTGLGPGSSGGPVWTGGPGGQYVRGLVSTGDSTTGQGFFTQLTASAIATIDRWVTQDDGHGPSGPTTPQASSVFGLVDPVWYDTIYPDVAAAGVDPASHYLAFGWHEDRSPDPFFSTVGYLAANPDVRAAGVDPAVHYDQSGWREGRDPAVNFDTRLYLEYNPDVARAGVDPLLHYLEFGRAEGRQIAPAIGPASQITGGFDREYYLLANPDVARAGADPLAHWQQFGWREGRDPNPFFDTQYYLQSNPDVARAGVDPLLHYDTYGWREGRDPSAFFSTSGYLSHNPDVARAGIDPLQHYLTNGIYEERATTF